MSRFSHKSDIITRDKTEILETGDETGTGLKPILKVNLCTIQTPHYLTVSGCSPHYKSTSL